MAIKKLKHNFTTPEQSKRLLELGLPADSADLYSSLGFENLVWVRNTKNELREDFFDALINGKSANIPIWSVGRLIEISLICGIGDKIPNELYINKYSLVDSLVENIISRLEMVADLSINEIDFSKLEE
jgi:hypothetical protein